MRSGKSPRALVPSPCSRRSRFVPLALSQDGQLLFAVNTPDNRLEIFHPRRDGLDKIASVEVGLEPVAVAVRSPNEVWVVNHLSDSVSVVNVSDPSNPSVTRTLLVGDEPRDIVFAGPEHDRAFVTTAHRGQNSPDDPDLFTPGVGRADVWVFDANNLGAAPGGDRLTKLTFFADTPRALAASADGKTVYAAAFFSGDQTTTVAADGAVSTMYPGGMPGPATITLGGRIIPQPSTGLIVKYKQGGPDGNYHWLDPYGTVFDPFVTVSLPDQDVFAIDATKSPPAPVDLRASTPTSARRSSTWRSTRRAERSTSRTPTPTTTSASRGTRPASRRSSATRSTAASPSSIRHRARSRPTNLNSHLDHAAGTGDPSLSRAFPQDLTVSRDGKQLYVVAQGSSKLAIYDTADLEAGSAPPTSANQVLLSGGGPTGVVVERADDVAFVLTRFDDAISVVDLGAKSETAHVAHVQPRAGERHHGPQVPLRRDATRRRSATRRARAATSAATSTASPGTSATRETSPSRSRRRTRTSSDVSTIAEASLARDLRRRRSRLLFAYYHAAQGADDDPEPARPRQRRGRCTGAATATAPSSRRALPFLDGSGNPVTSAQPNLGIFDEVNAFKSFNVAFPGLVGNAAELSTPTCPRSRPSRCRSPTRRTRSATSTTR